MNQNYPYGIKDMLIQYEQIKAGAYFFDFDGLMG